MRPAALSFFLIVAVASWASEVRLTGAAPDSMAERSRVISAVQEAAERFSRESGAASPEVLTLNWYATTSEFMRTTGADVWTGALYQSGRIELQPYRVLSVRDGFETLIGHETVHAAMENLKSLELTPLLSETAAQWLYPRPLQECPPLSPSAVSRFGKGDLPAGERGLFSRSCQDFAWYLRRNGVSLKTLCSLDTAGLDGLYRGFYEANSPLVRVWVNPRGESLIRLRFEGEAGLTLSVRGSILRKTMEGGARIELHSGSLIVDAFPDVQFERIEFHFPEGFVLNGAAYRGSLLLTVRDGRLYAVNVLPVEEYLYGVVQAEMPSSSLEALKAQAVLCRTLAYIRVRERVSWDYDVTSLTEDQNYRGRAVESEAACRAVDETCALVLWWNERMPFPFYSSTCGGQTESAREIWGPDSEKSPSVLCSLSNEALCSGSAHFESWERSISIKELSELMGFEVNSLTVSEITPSGRVRAFGVEGRTIPFDRFKSALAKRYGWAFLKSNLLTVTNEAERVVFRGRGLGHGAGLCQYGAMRLADKYGYDALSILRFYWPGAELAPVSGYPKRE